ncbi:hypothetical protein [Stenotrophomonas sp. PFBMAA-4]|uniref:hypothetical protein n=1 Tax=Stenotrophomonas sp. PFBMAA-4 TaxID=3043301 RepID=UPI0024B602C8|nr:hypothetical protein [Stenotrophomonas sp. PFBMAA-4]MDI9271793.1 hypothetical protein [Stenotrophomonas sp. PFBMAA-4]
MKINICRITLNRFIAVPQGHALPESWAGAKFFKTIDLHPDDERIGIGNPKAILAAIEQDGFALM